MLTSTDRKAIEHEIDFCRQVISSADRKLTTFGSSSVYDYMFQAEADKKKYEEKLREAERKLRG